MAIDQFTLEQLLAEKQRRQGGGGGLQGLLGGATSPTSGLASGARGVSNAFAIQAGLAPQAAPTQAGGGLTQDLLKSILTQRIQGPADLATFREKERIKQEFEETPEEVLTAFRGKERIKQEFEETPEEALSLFRGKERIKQEFDEPDPFEEAEFAIKQQKEVRDQATFVRETKEAARETAEEQSAEAERNEITRAGAEDLLETIKEVKKGSRFFGVAGALPTILSPSSLIGDRAERAKWEANVNKLLSQKVIDVMTEMKEASKTGATGFGQLSEKELQVLQNASTALQRNLAPEDALELLDEMERIQKKFLSGGGTNQRPVGGDVGGEVIDLGGGFTMERG